MQKKYQPVLAVQEGKFNTFNGSVIDLFAPSLDDINIDDISNSLSKICRFGGHTSTFYSVAQHSILVAAMAPADIKREALLHDGTEAYVGDVISPLKHILGDVYKSIELRFMKVIAEKFQLREEVLLTKIKPLDLLALELEHEALQRNNFAPLLSVMSEHNLIVENRFAYSPRVAADMFKTMFHQILK